MIRKTLLTGVCVLTALALAHGTLRAAGWSQFLERLTGQLQPAEQGLSQSEIVDGLKEALKIGTVNAVRLTSKLDGYYKNPQIKIPLPEKVQKMEKVLRIAGLGDQVTDFELSMNRAAEKAAPAAEQLFVDAIAQMSFADARRILKGRANEATLYFKGKTYQPLEERFKPLVHTAMAEVGITRSYQKLDTTIRTLSLGSNHDFDLDQYVTAKALDGLFLVLSQQEAKIRNDPAARVTDLLKKVFGAVK
jgi:hypothetical protein